MGNPNQFSENLQSSLKVQYTSVVLVYLILYFFWCVCAVLGARQSLGAGAGQVQPGQQVLPGGAHGGAGGIHTDPGDHATEVK